MLLFVLCFFSIAKTYCEDDHPHEYVEETNSKRGPSTSDFRDGRSIASRGMLTSESLKQRFSYHLKDHSVLLQPEGETPFSCSHCIFLDHVTGLSHEPNLGSLHIA